MQDHIWKKIMSLFFFSILLKISLWDLWIITSSMTCFCHAILRLNFKIFNCNIQFQLECFGGGWGSSLEDLWISCSQIIENCKYNHWLYSIFLQKLYIHYLKLFDLMTIVFFIYLLVSGMNDILLSLLKVGYGI